jgi:hypothetical protein
MRKAKMSRLLLMAVVPSRYYRTAGRVLKHANTRSGTPLTTESPFDEPLKSIAFVNQVDHCRQFHLLFPGLVRRYQ